MAPPPADDGRVKGVARVARYLVTLPERVGRMLFAGAGGVVHESAYLLLPRFVRRSRLYEATAKNVLRVAIELLGGVPAGSSSGISADEVDVGRMATSKAVGNVAEVGAIAALGFSPLWLLAAAADLMNGSRTYLRALEGELVAAGLLPPDARFTSLDQLMGALEGTAADSARVIDLPPLELQALKRAVADLGTDVASLPTPAELAALFDGLKRTAEREHLTLLQLSSGLGLAFLASARTLGREQVVQPYREDWQPLAEEGIAAYVTRVARPYGDTMGRHLDPRTDTLTERLPAYARRAWRWVRSHVGR